jgi:exopolysaccharide biosynthesis polyprenyl glycosylphosphotransferase
VSQFIRPSSVTSPIFHVLKGRRVTVALLLSDFLAAWISFFVGLAVLSKVSSLPANNLHHLSSNLNHGWGFALSMLVALTISGRYRAAYRSPTQSTFNDLRDYFHSAVLGGFITLLAARILDHIRNFHIVVTTQVVIGTMFAGIVFAFSHSLVRHIVLSRYPIRIAIVDDGSDFNRIQTHLKLQHGVDVVGRINPSSPSPEDCIGSLPDAESIITDFRLNRIIFGSSSKGNDEYVDAYRLCSQLVDIELVPRTNELISWRSRLTEINGLPVLEIAPRHASPYDQVLKRAFDITFSLSVLVLSLPLTLCLALMIKLTSRGPIFFRQSRLGYRGTSFVIWKFRTLRNSHVDHGSTSEDGNSMSLALARKKSLLQSDYTPIGRFLRRSGLDELPQFLNVLAGSMSIVGPRPFVSNESDLTSPTTIRRYDVRPGITGLWQVTGRNELTLEELGELDYLYVSAWSFWWDVKICFETPRAMFRGLGAY